MSSGALNAQAQSFYSSTAGKKNSSESESTDKVTRDVIIIVVVWSSLLN